MSSVWNFNGEMSGIAVVLLKLIMECLKFRLERSLRAHNRDDTLYHPKFNSALTRALRLRDTSIRNYYPLQTLETHNTYNSSRNHENVFSAILKTLF